MLNYFSVVYSRITCVSMDIRSMEMIGMSLESTHLELNNDGFIDCISSILMEIFKVE
jgi:hypothetical protein